MPSSRGSFRPRDQTWVSRIAGKFFATCTTREALHIPFLTSPGALNGSDPPRTFSSPNFPLPTPILTQTALSTEFLDQAQGRCPPGRVCGTEVTQPPSPQCLRIRLCQLQGRCHRKQEQGQRLERGVTHQKDAGSGEVSSVHWAAWGWGESQGCCLLHNISFQCTCARARTRTHTHTHTAYPLLPRGLVLLYSCQVISDSL